MSWYASGFVKAITISPSGKPITRGEKLILLILADYHNSERNYADPSINRLAEEGLYERRQVMRIVESLEEKGFIRTEKESNRNTKYFILGLPEEVVTKCHHGKSKVVTFKDDDGDIGGDISPSKMSPEPIRTIEPIKTTEGTPYFFELTPPNPEDLKRETQKEKQAKEKFCLPEWVPVFEWDGWIDMRKQMRKPATEMAKGIAVKRLQKLRDSGEDILEVMQTAIEKNWLTFYAVNKNSNGNGHQPPPIEDALERERRKEAERKRV